MPSYFPRQTVKWKVEEAAAFRRLTLSMGAMALITGVAVRLFRSLLLSQTWDSLVYVGAYYVIFAIILSVMTALHLGNYTVRHWVWRAPVFAALEAAAEMATSFVLILLGREPFGTDRADMSHWPALAVGTLFRREIQICLFALVLAGVVQSVRSFLRSREHRAAAAKLT